MEPVNLPFDSKEFPPMPQQEYSNIPIQQKGLHTKGFEFIRMSKEVEGLVSNYQRIIDGYIFGAPWNELVKAKHLLAGNFDGPIFEFKL